MSSSFKGLKVKHSAVIPHVAGANESTLWVNSSDNNNLYLNGNAVSSTPVTNPTVDPDYQGYTQTDQTGLGYTSSKALLFNVNSLAYNDSGAERTLSLGDTVSKNVTWTGVQTINFDQGQGPNINYIGPNGLVDNVIDITKSRVNLTAEGPAGQVAGVSLGNITGLGGEASVTMGVTYQSSPGQTRNIFSLSGSNGAANSHGVRIGDNLITGNNVLFTNDAVTFNRSNQTMMAVSMVNNQVTVGIPGGTRIEYDRNLEFLFGYNNTPAQTFEINVANGQCRFGNTLGNWFDFDGTFLRGFNGANQTWFINCANGSHSFGLGQNNTIVFDSTVTLGDVWTMTNNTISRVAKFTAETINSVNEVAIRVNAFLGREVFIEENGLIQGGQNLYDWIKDQFGL